MDPICRKAHLADDSVKKVLILLKFGLDIMGKDMSKLILRLLLRSS